MPVIRLLIADDHAIVREGLKQIFSLAADIEIAGEAASGAELLDVLEGRMADLLLLDMTMPGIHGAELVGRIRVRHPELPILVLSMHNSPQIVRRAIKAGASGYLSKDTVPEILIAAVRKIAAGGRFIDPVLAERMAFDVNESVKDLPHAYLSEREFQIMCLLVCGKGINEIADELAISNKTVSTHKANLMQKMGFKSNADMVSYGLTHGLLA